MRPSRFSRILGGSSDTDPTGLWRRTGERGLGIGCAFWLVVAGLAWYLGGPALFFGLLGGVLALSALVQYLDGPTGNAPSYTSSPTAPILEEPVVKRDLWAPPYRAPISPRDLRALPYAEYLQTPHWKRMRQDKVRAAGHRCQFCNRGSVTLNVHHRTYERLGEEHDGDLTVLCQDCHHILHEHRRLGR